MKLKKTVLDGELNTLASIARKTGKKRSELPLQSCAAKKSYLDSDSEASPSSQITLKLIAKSGLVKTLENWVERQGGAVTSTSPSGIVLLADLPVTSLKKLDRLKSVVRAEAPRIQLPRMDRARGKATGLSAALRDHDLDGSGVVIGVIDSGIDWTHPDFLDDAGRTRLEVFTHARVPANSDVSVFDDFDASDINSALSGNAVVPQGDPGGHGTHCASIAGGNGRASAGQFSGVAPAAQLMGMRSEPLLDNHTIRGIREFFRRADDRPAVISLSLGSHVGPHDGTSAIENVIARESGPGRIVVVAAGNEGNDSIH